MEYLEGETLEEVLTRRGKLPAAEVTRLLRQALEGLQHLHEQDVVRCYEREQFLQDEIRIRVARRDGRNRDDLDPLGNGHAVWNGVGEEQRARETDAHA